MKIFAAVVVGRIRITQRLPNELSRKIFAANSARILRCDFMQFNFSIGQRIFQDKLAIAVIRATRIHFTAKSQIFVGVQQVTNDIFAWLFGR